MKLKSAVEESDTNLSASVERVDKLDRTIDQFQDWRRTLTHTVRNSFFEKVDSVRPGKTANDIYPREGSSRLKDG